MKLFLQFIEQYRALGYLPEALLNFIVLLGWSPVGEKEIFNRKQLVKIFDENRLSKSPINLIIKSWSGSTINGLRLPINMVFDKLIEQLVYSSLLFSS